MRCVANCGGVMIKSGDRIATGTGANRRRLTEAEAMAGGLPDPMTKEEWRLLHDAAVLQEEYAMRRKQRKRDAALQRRM